MSSGCKRYDYADMAHGSYGLFLRVTSTKRFWELPHEHSRFVFAVPYSTAFKTRGMST